MNTKKDGLGERWRKFYPSKTTLFWSCVLTAVVTMIVGFTWGGWVTGGSAASMADSAARTAVIQRLAPICVAQFDSDPEKAEKLALLRESTSNQRAKYIRDQGWATISGEEAPNSRVSDACAALLMQVE